MTGKVSFNESTKTFFLLYEQGNFSCALDECQRLLSLFPEEKITLTNWRICMLSRMGKQEKALVELRDALNSGMWWQENALRQDPDLEILRGDPEFERLLEICAKLAREAQHSSKAKHSLLIPHSTQMRPPAVFVMHGRQSSIQREIQSWQLIQELGWLVVLMQSSQVASPQTFCWDDEIKAAEEIQQHYKDVSADVVFDNRSILLAGFSQGAARSIQFALQQVIPVQGFLAIVPGGIHLDETMHNAQRLQPGTIRGYMVTGSEDRRFSEHKEVIQLLNTNGVVCGMEIIQGMGHTYPDDFRNVFNNAIQFIFQEE